MAVVFLQILAVSLTLELSGLEHVALDGLALDAGTAHPTDDCEKSGHECPPGCPNCHVAHSILPGVVALHIQVELRPLHPASITLGFVPSEVAPPAGADRARLDRPPKVARHA